MMKPRLLGTALLLVAQGLAAQTLIINGRALPLEGISTILPEPSSSHVQLVRAVNAPNQWTYSMDETKRLLGTVDIKQSSAPTGYSAGSLAVRVPYASSRPLQVFFYAIKVAEPGANETARIRELHATPIGGDKGEHRHEQLFRLYQEARVIAARRLQRIQAQNDFNYYDAQAFLKLLEISVQLGREANLTLGSDVLEVRNFVRSQRQSAEGLRVLTKGTGQTEASVKQQVEFIDLVEAEHLKNLWSEVKASTKGGARPEDCKRYEAFVQTATGADYDAGLVKQWDQLKDYNMVSLAAKALEACAERTRQAALQAATEVTKARVESLQRAIGSLEAVQTPSIENSLGRIRRSIAF